MADAREHVTTLLGEVSRGDRSAWERLLPLVYEELRKIAGGAMRREKSAHTLQPTALVHEAYLRLSGQDQPDFRSRLHFFAAAAEMMRRVLVDHARARLAQKRGGGASKSELDEALVYFESRSTDVLALDEAIGRLEAIDAIQARIVELRFFGGLSVAETAEVLTTSPATVERGWRMARAWLLREVSAMRG